ncbi:MAG: TonB-dependent receptor [Opitutus sp.]|nr:TonB-dependent receptor [Opitutus sp.]
MQNRMKLLRLVALGLFVVVCRAAQKSEEGIVTGVVFGPAGEQPVEYATVALKKKTSGETVRTAATDRRGAFALESVPFGDYKVVYGLVGGDSQETPPFAVNAQHRSVALGRLVLTDGTVKMEKLEVNTRRDAFYKSIDRRVYNVGKDIQSVTGSASNLLQNVPSVQVDIEGNVSLRGDGNVLILINGKTSTMMGKNRAAVLEQMPADGIEKIEVITNPSAKYKPDGTAGIINITLKRKADPGYSGSVHVAVGNDDRYNSNVTASYHPGKYTFSGSAEVRQDDRPRFVNDERSHPDSKNTLVATQQNTTESSRPLSRVARAGVDYQADEHTKIGAAMNYNYRNFVRQATESSLTRTGAVVTKDYDRLRTNPNFQKDLEFTGTLQHSFPKEEQELTIEVKQGKTIEEEDNRYTVVYRLPFALKTFDNTLNRVTETSTEGTVDYIYPIGDKSKFEAGYNGLANKVDLDFRGTFLSPLTQTLQVDPQRTNRFIYDAMIHAVYSTYAHKLGNFGFLAGLRFERAVIHTDQFNTRLLDQNDYNRFYPSLHLNYNFTDRHQVQLNYSHRVHRPEGDDFNPFPKYQDPTNLRAGNPHLRPEEIHSVETGYQYKHNDTTYLATIYHRYRYHSMTDVARFVDSATLFPSRDGTVLFTTKENLGSSRSTGVELGATARLKERVSLNFSGNIYHNEIDASNLGFSSRRSTTAWDAKLNLNWDVTKTTLVQLNTNYTAKRLTPQGYRHPTYLANLGLRHNFKDKKMAFTLSVSDVFNSLKERTFIDTPALHQEVTRHRSSRIFYAGVIYNFGKPAKKTKDDLQFDNSL